MLYRIKVENPDSVGDILVKLQRRHKWCPIWSTVEYTWIDKHNTMQTTLENTKAYFKELASRRENPAIKAHVENFNV